MTVRELKEIIENLSDNTEIKINSVWDDNLKELTPVDCDGFYSEKYNKVYFTPFEISI